jgi:hypothetical protein
MACHLQIDVDMEPAYHFDADPDPCYQLDADPEPTFQFDADPRESRSTLLAMRAQRKELRHFHKK